MDQATNNQPAPVFSGKFEDALDLMHQVASKLTGADDFGQQSEYLPGLKVLLKSLDAQQNRFSEIGKQFSFNILTGQLCSRLRVINGLKEFPQCLKKPIKSPVIIVGLPRTGTTALFHLLSLDPQFQVPERWLIDAPMPRPSKSTWQNYPEYQQCVQGLEQLAELSPHFMAVHQRHADLADECLDITSQCFSTTLWGVMFPAAEYDAWWPSQPHTAEYHYMKQVLQLIGANDDRVWLLKDPSSLLHLPELKKVFPDISIIVTHRSPVDVMPSVCSLVSAPRKLVLGENYDATELSDHALKLWAKAANKLDPKIVPEFDRRTDVSFTGFQVNPMDTIKNIYSELGLTLTTEAQQAMQEDIKRNKQKIRQPHQYSLEEYGLDAEQVCEEFSCYIHNFGPFIGEEKTN